MKQNKYAPYPESNWDAAVKETARIKLVKPKKNICIYCHAQAVIDTNIKHAADYPWLLDPKNKNENKISSR